VRRLVSASSMVSTGEGRYECSWHGVVRPGPRRPADLEAGRFEPPGPRRFPRPCRRSGPAPRRAMPPSPVTATRGLWVPAIKCRDLHRARVRPHYVWRTQTVRCRLAAVSPVSCSATSASFRSEGRSCRMSREPGTMAWGCASASRTSRAGGVTSSCALWVASASWQSADPAPACGPQGLWSRRGTLHRCGARSGLIRPQPHHSRRTSARCGTLSFLRGIALSRIGVQW
jgi:hypothetical protein